MSGVISKTVPILAAFLMLTFLVGCGSRGTSPEELLAKANQTNLDRICNLYFQFQLKHGMNGPADEAAFKKFIQELPSAKLKRIGVDPADIDSVFISDRDNEKFEILWSVVVDPRGEPVAIVAEKTGVEGLRMVGFTSPPHQEVDQAEYKRIFRQ